MNKLSLHSTEVSNFAAGFIEDLLKMFHSRQKRISLRLVEKHLENLMIAVVREGSISNGIYYSFTELTRCLNSSEFVRSSINPFGILEFQWHQEFLHGLTWYSLLRRVIEVRQYTLIHCVLYDRLNQN